MTDILISEFTQTIQPLARRYDIHRLFDDLLTLIICSHHRTNIQSQLQEQDEANEAMYHDIIQRYEKDELTVFAQLTGILYNNVLQAPYSDLLGEYFMQEISKGHNGQYFTPMPVCEMMASIQMGDPEAAGLRVADPASGSGRMLLACAKRQPANYFYAADVSHSCAKMAAVNFFLNGLRGEVSWMNSLSNEWFGGWSINTHGVGILPLTSEQESEIVLRLPESKASLNESATEQPQSAMHQLRLFD